jgi:hypothetical protein
MFLIVTLNMFLAKFLRDLTENFRSLKTNPSFPADKALQKQVDKNKYRYVSSQKGFYFKGIVSRDGVSTDTIGVNFRPKQSAAYVSCTWRVPRQKFMTCRCKMAGTWI